MHSPRIVPRSSYFDLYPERKRTTSTTAHPREETAPIGPTPPSESYRSRYAPTNVVEYDDPLSASTTASTAPSLSLLQRARRGSAASLVALAQGFASSSSTTSPKALTSSTIASTSSHQSIISPASSYSELPPATKRRPSAGSIFLSKAFGSSKSSLVDKSSRNIYVDASQSRRDSESSVASSSKSSSKNSGSATKPLIRTRASSTSSPNHFRRPSAISIPPGLSDSPEITPNRFNEGSAPPTDYITFSTPSYAPQRPRSPPLVPASRLPDPPSSPAPPSTPPPFLLLHPDRRSKASKSSSSPISDIFPSRASSISRKASAIDANKLALPHMGSPHSARSISSFSRDLEAAFATTTGAASPPASPASTTSRFSFKSASSSRKPLSNIFPGRSGSSRTPSSVLHAKSSSSLDSEAAAAEARPRTSSSASSRSSRGIGGTASHSGEPARESIDIFAGPSEYDPTTGTYRSSRQNGSTESSPADLDDLVASLNGRVIGGSRSGAWSRSSSSKSTKAALRSPKIVSSDDFVRTNGNEVGRMRESSSDSSETSYANIDAGPVSQNRSMVAPGMDRDPTLKADERERLFGGLVRPAPIMYALPALRYGSSSTTSSPKPASPTRVTPPAPPAKLFDDDGEEILHVKKDARLSRAGSDDVSPRSATFDREEVMSEPISVPTPPPPPIRIRSIDEIVREHADAAYLAKHGKKETPAQRIVAETQQKSASSGAGTNGSTIDAETSEKLQKLNLDSRNGGETDSPLSTTFTSSSSANRTGDSRSLLDEPSTRSSKTSASPLVVAAGLPRSSPASPIGLGFETPSVERELALLLRSPRLTRIITLHRPPNLGLTVSLADVGATNGHPVIIFLGLGCVRYLVTLYDEIARAFNLRLICLDRWGLGRTSAVPDEKRGFAEWALVVEEVAEHLGLSSYSILAHSAGGPYALASALKSPRTVHGSLHLLAPWISTSADSLAGAYKLLKYVPTGVIKTAQAADWKMTSRRLGKPPTIQHAAVGYDHRHGKLQWTGGDDRSQGPSVDELIGSAPGKLVDEDGYDAISLSSAMSSDGTPKNAYASRPGGPLKTKSSRAFLGSLFNGSPSNSASPKSPIGSDSTPSRGKPIRRNSSSSLVSPPTTPGGLLLATPLSNADLSDGILRASHAESVRGATSDLLVILERGSKSNSVVAKYTDLEAPVKIWHGEKDERISLSSIRNLQPSMRDCRLRVVEDGDHNLMTNGRVMVEVLESIADEWR